uniref:Sodium/nucleoside cotransporter n=1 Tax=Panagrolaimus sp. PS1159 TaxID=55785 RepID=A0AC35FVE1_9BILA
MLTVKTYEQLVSLCGLLILIFFSGIFSKHPARINLWQILLGTYLQCVIALLVLKWPTGKSSLNWLMEKTIEFLSFTGNGTDFVYGFVPRPPNICGMDGPFAYTSLPVITFFGALCSLLYYYGVFQWILIKFATLLYYSMGTTAAESLNAIASVFLGPTEAAVLVQSSTGTMTRSEIVTTMTAGYSMIDGSLFATYIAFGACPVYLIAANFMSAPATLVISKILHPEVQASIQKEMKTFRFPPCIKVIAAIIANLIVYVALITMADVCIGWLGSLVGYSDISFTKIMSWIFYPFAYILGVTQNHDETMKVAKLIGLKTVLNEFYAYQQMSVMLTNNQLSDRSQMIAIFALCGYSNFSQIGSQIGIFGALSPKRRKAFVKCATRSMIGGEIACFMTACIAGAIVSEAGGCLPSSNSANCLAV